MRKSELVEHLLENYYTDDPRKGLSVISLSIKLEESAIFGLAHNYHICAKAYFNHLYTAHPGALANSDPDEMLQNAAFHQGLHCLLR